MVNINNSLYINNKKIIVKLILGTSLVLLFLTGTGVVVEHTMAQAQSSNKTEITVAKTPEE